MHCKNLEEVELIQILQNFTYEYLPVSQYRSNLYDFEYILQDYKNTFLKRFIYSYMENVFKINEPDVFMRIHTNFLERIK